MAHLHCPVMQPSLIAELFISVLNQSMDSWDQSPIATYIEQSTTDWLNSLIYKSEDILSRNENPKVIGKYEIKIIRGESQ